jgi:hypothetical protein
MATRNSRRRADNDNASAVMLDAALAYGARGLPIFPCRADKKPLIDEWQLAATTDRAQIRKWWRRFPSANIGMHAGDAGLLVLDYDPGSDKAEVEQNVGKLPKTRLRARTPRGGTHEYYALKPGEIVPNSASKLAEHVDVRSFHGYVLLPPSRTADGAYEWIEQGKPAFRTDEMRRVASTARDKSKDRDNWIIEPDLDENVQACERWLATEAKIAVEGQGGDTKAYATAAHCRSFGLSEEQALDSMWSFWNPRCSPPWSLDDFEHFNQKVVNGYRYASSDPGNITPAYREAKNRDGFTVRSKASAVSQTSEHEFTAGRFRAATRDGIEAIEPPEWLMDSTLTDGGFGMIVGAPGTFKTFLALDAALRICADFSEEAPFGSVLKPGPVLFAVGEGRANLRKRITAWERTHSRGKKLRDFVLIDPVPNVTEDWAPFIELAKRASPKGYRLVVLDTVGRSMQGADENTQKDASKFTKLVETIQRELHACVLAIHHTGHGNVERSKGSMEFIGAPDSIFVVTRNAKDYMVSVTNTKQKDAEEWSLPRYVKLAKITTPIGESLVAVKAAECDIPRSSARDDTEIVRDIHARFILGALRGFPGKQWKASELASEARKRGCQIKFDTLRTDVLSVKKGKPGWARTHRALEPYFPPHDEKWATPQKLPQMDPVFALKDDEIQ